MCTILTQMMFNPLVSTKIPQKWLSEKWESSAFWWIMQRCPMLILTKDKTCFENCYFSSEITMTHGYISGLYFSTVLRKGEIWWYKFAVVDKNILWQTIKKWNILSVQMVSKVGKSRVNISIWTRHIQITISGRQINPNINLNWIEFNCGIE